MALGRNRNSNRMLCSTMALIGAMYFACQSPSLSLEDEDQIRRLFTGLAHDLSGATPSGIGPYLTEAGHHESAGPYHHRPIIELLMRFRDLHDIDIEIYTITATDDRAHVRCAIRGRELHADGSAEEVQQEEIFELRRDTKGWRIADHVVS